MMVNVIFIHILVRPYQVETVPQINAFKFKSNMLNIQDFAVQLHPLIHLTTHPLQLLKNVQPNVITLATVINGITDLALFTMVQNF